MAEQAEDRKLKSGVRMLRVIEALKASDGMGVTDLADGLGVSKSTVHAHLATLRDEGYVFKDGDDRYKLGLKFLDVGVVARQNRDDLSPTKRKIREIADQTGEKAWCIVEEQGKAVFLYEAQGENAIQTFAYPGKRAELFELAGGRAILANMPSERRAELFEEYEREDRLAGVPFTLSELKSDLERIREREYAFNPEYYVKHVAAVGVPIMDNRDVVRGALSISGPMHRLEGQKLEEEFPKLLLGIANEVGVNMSYE